MQGMPDDIRERWESLTPEERAALIELAWLGLRRGEPKEGPFAEWLAEQEAAHRPCNCTMTEHFGPHCKRCKQPWPCHMHTLVQGYQFQQPMPADRMQA